MKIMPVKPPVYIFNRSFFSLTLSLTSFSVNHLTSQLAVTLAKQHITYVQYILFILLMALIA